MNEAEARVEYIDPKLMASGWDIREGPKALCEFRVTRGQRIV